MIGFVFLTYRFLEPIAEFTEVLDQTQTAVAGLRRVLGVLDIPAGPPPPTESQALPPGRLDIDVRDVTFSYRTRADRDLSDDTVLRHLNIHIPAGQQVAMVGATGSGKTTLGRLIARFADPTVGEIWLGGVPLMAVDNDELRRRLDRRRPGAVPVRRHDRAPTCGSPVRVPTTRRSSPSSPGSTSSTGWTRCPMG